MTVIRRNPVNRLSQLIRKPGGITVSQALEDAQKNLDNIQGSMMGVLDQKLAEVQAIVVRCRTAPTPADLKRLYALGDDILELAGPAGMGELGQAAFSLCELIDRFVSFRKYSWAALQVHLDGLTALRAAEGRIDAHTNQVLDGLKLVAATIKGDAEAG